MFWVNSANLNELILHKEKVLKPELFSPINGLIMLFNDGEQFFADPLPSLTAPRLK
jgi:hypothetical protein